MLKNIISIVGAIVIGIIALKIFGFAFSIVLTLFFGLFKFGIILIVALPCYFFIRNKLNKSNRF
ncbi:MAG: hypothetical protein LBO69_07155 [Ignavibacteria bacterium]|jgi:hypothetical protein|nr:hypothetical protein [Ignavibacteria bacterium]